MSSVDEAFRRARIQSARHMAACESAKLAWGETSVTEMVIANAATAVTVVPFTQRAERLSGADWVWWWVDGSASYGMLVQAKRVTIHGARWSFNFDYKPSGATRLQRETLIDTAGALELLPVHALYLGTGAYRQWAACSGSHWKSRCPECTRRTISLMPALLATDSLVDDSSSTYEWSVALENIWNPPEEVPILIPALRRAMTPELVGFLEAKPDGTRAVARAMVDRVLRARAGMFNAVEARRDSRADGSHDQLGAFFKQLPSDTMHGGVRYLDHVLNPLKHVPPSYVLEILDGEVEPVRLKHQLSGNVAGIVVIQTPQRVGRTKRHP